MPVAALIPVLLLLPFLNKAYHVDDTLFVYTAKQIARAPLDFYGFNVNWYVTPQPMAEVMQNPPLQGYWLALIGTFFGWREVALHAGMLPIVFLACWLTALLGWRFGTSPVWAALGLGLSPAFFVSATQVMCDVTFLMFYLAAIYLWVRGLDREDVFRLGLASLAISAAVLTKYFGLTLIPLLAVYTLYHPGIPLRRYAWFLVPVGIVAGYEICTAWLYGNGLLLDAVRYAWEARSQLALNQGVRPERGVVFLAACFSVPACWGFICLGRRGRWIAGVVLVAAVVAGPLLFGPDSLPVSTSRYQYWGWFGVGAVLLGVLVYEWRRYGDAESALLTLWTGGTLVFAVCCNHYVNARVLLPLGPALVILVLRNGRVARRVPRRILLGATTAALGLCTLYIAAADHRLANNARRAARELLALEARTIWFAGHWGFQYYMEEGGAKALDPGNPAWEAGDVLVVPRNNVPQVKIPPAAIARYEVRQYPVLQGVMTLNTEAGAGFYADSIGPLPYVAGPAMAEAYGVIWLLGRE